MRPAPEQYGPDQPPAAPGGEGGMLSLASLFVVLGLSLLFCLLSNVAHVANQKIETQSAADAAAYSAAVELARGMNALTATNHLIGELTALVVLTHALGGDELDSGRRPARTPTDLRLSLQLSYRLALIADFRPVAAQYSAVSQEPGVGGTIRDCRIRLKQVMNWAYIAHGVGGIFQKVKLPIVGWVLYAYGSLIVTAAMAFETKVYEEWLVLDALERVTTRALNPVKRALSSAVIPGLHNLYARGMVLKAPFDAERVAAEVGKRNAAEGSLFPRALSYPRLRLPVQAEPQRLRDLTRSQLMRATAPWVRHWRLPLLRFGESLLLLSRFKCHYMTRTNELTYTLCKRLKEDRGVNLYVLDGVDLDRADKGREAWNKADGSAQADQLFTVVGLAHRPPPRVFGYGIFRQANPDGLVTYAQAMIYNANPPPARAARGMQPVLGWDTLNWAAPVPEFSWDQPRPPDCPIEPVPEPLIRLNWQAKLTPTTRLRGAAAHSLFLGQSERVGPALRRAGPLPGALPSTH